VGGNGSLYWTAPESKSVVSAGGSIGEPFENEDKEPEQLPGQNAGPRPDKGDQMRLMVDERATI